MMKTRNPEEINITLLSIFAVAIWVCYTLYGLFPVAIDKEFIYWPLVWIYIFIGIAVLIYCVLGCIEVTQTYELSEKGITRGYLGAFKRVYSWNEVKDIAVCDMNHSKDGKRYSLVIRISVKDERIGPLSGRNAINPLSGKERWREELYCLNHMKKVFLIDYTNEKYDEIKSICGRKITDRRTIFGRNEQIEF